MTTLATYVMPPRPRMVDENGNIIREAFRFWQQACHAREEALWPHYRPPSSSTSSISDCGLPSPISSEYGRPAEPSLPHGVTSKYYPFMDPSIKRYDPKESWRRYIQATVKGAKNQARRIRDGPAGDGVYKNTRSRTRKMVAIFAELGSKYEMIITREGSFKIDGERSYIVQGRKKTKAHEMSLLYGSACFPVAVKQDMKMSYFPHFPREEMPSYFPPESHLGVDFR